ncbi:MAG: isoprenylcysteine carboxylmethyltransferase family protein [Desulfosalsimonas sp.]|uniref:methyltransferase family protein n=1 Tax=Desulfosalsimonas sp. TaxID=3073848 RepID=UPI0039710B68
MAKSENHTIAKVVALISLVLSAGSLLWFAAFLYAGSFSVLDLGLSFCWALLLNAGLSLAFFLQHSIMVRKWFRVRARKCLREPYHGVLFSLSSAAVLLIVLTAWQKSSCLLFSAEGVSRLAFRMVFAASVAGFAWGGRTLRSVDGFDNHSLLLRAGNPQSEIDRLATRGPYKFVRHPLYFFTLLMIWSCPDITADRLVFNVLWSGWIVTGAWLEEKDLVRDFGRPYRDYQKAVPMLIPWKTLIRR